MRKMKTRYGLIAFLLTLFTSTLVPTHRAMGDTISAIATVYAGHQIEKRISELNKSLDAQPQETNGSDDSVAAAMQDELRRVNETLQTVLLELPTNPPSDLKTTVFTVINNGCKALLYYTLNPPSAEIACKRIALLDLAERIDLALASDPTPFFLDLAVKMCNVSERGKSSCLRSALNSGGEKEKALVADCLQKTLQPYPQTQYYTVKNADDAFSKFSEPNKLAVDVLDKHTIAIDYEKRAAYYFQGCIETVTAATIKSTSGLSTAKQSIVSAPSVGPGAQRVR